MIFFRMMNLLIHSSYVGFFTFRLNFHLGLLNFDDTIYLQIHVFNVRNFTYEIKCDSA